MSFNSARNFFAIEHSIQTCTGFDPTRIYMLGEKNSGLKPRGILQNYNQLKCYHLRCGTLFEDPQFLPELIEMGDNWAKMKENIEWLRPNEIVRNPKFVSDGKDRFDINQGDLGDCWFLAAIADVVRNHRLTDLIVPPGQSFHEDYVGIFHFRFWQYGRWIDIVVDDRLPTYKGKLIYLKSNRPDEFWTPLMEKAYAKLYGSYKNIEGGFTSDALQDLTGGLTEIYLELLQLQHKIDFFSMMEISFKKQSYMGCGITNTTEMEGERSDGLYTRHAYSITGVIEINGRENNNNFKLLRIRNPWGQCEWRGNWSDNSDTWNLVSEGVKKHLQKIKDDGEFWMEFKDFITSYTLLEFCHPNPASLKVAQDEMQRWKSFMIDGAWVAKVTSGGLPNNKDFYRNPQYLITLNGPEKNKTYRILIGLMQKNRRIHRLPELPIGFAVYRVIDSVIKGERLSRDFLGWRKPINVRHIETSKQITGHMELSNGSYCIIPFTDDSRTNCEFLLRVYSEVSFTVKEHDEEVGMVFQKENDKRQDVVDSKAADKAIQEVFKSFAGVDEQISWVELKNILDLLLKGENQEFSKEVCRSMVALMDTDQSGKLNFHEFFELWEKIGIWRGTFRTYDLDQLGTVSGKELREALRASEIQVNNRILNMLMLRYANEKGEMDMEDFLHCCIKLTAMIEMYETGDYQGKRTDWIIDTIYT